MKIFDRVCASLGARVLLESELAAFFQDNPSVDRDADYSRVAVLGPRGSVWEEPDGRTYIVAPDEDGTPREFLPNE